MTASIHRFRDKVAVYLGEGQSTVYLTPQCALDLSEALVEAAVDVQRQPDFSKSKFGSRTIGDETKRSGRSGGPHDQD